MLSTAALVFPMANVATLVGPDGTTANEGIPLTSLIAGIFVISMGMMGMVLGYLQLVHDYGNRWLTGFLMIYSQLAWVPYITDLTNVGKLARTGEAFIPMAYEPEEEDVKFVGAMGMMGILGYGCGFLGSFSFMIFSLYAYQMGHPEDRNSSYFRGRMKLYIFCLFLVALAQLMLGSYIKRNFGDGPLLENGAIGVAMFMVNFPEISIFCGTVQLCLSCFGVARIFGVLNGPTNNTYQIVALFSWICTVSMQNLSQIAYAPGGMAAPMAPSVTMLTLGLNVFPAYLDYKMRNTPDVLPEGYYGLSSADYKKQPTTTGSDKSEEAH